MLQTLDNIFEEFTELDREDQSRYLLELGDQLPEFPDDARTPENKVHGCQSQVWLITESTGKGDDATVSIRADSDSNIVRGLIAILQAAYNGKTARDILEFDILGVFSRLELSQHISPQRRNGLRGMVERILALARTHLQAADSHGLRLYEPATMESGSAPDRRAARDSVPARSLNIQEIRSQFPVLNRPVRNGLPPVYLDSGASSQKPQVVIDKEREVEEQYYANAHRGTYQLGIRIDEEFEGARETVAEFLNSPAISSVIFTPGTTIGLNMIASGWGRRHVQRGDEILITLMEHHANFVPWQQLAKERGASLRFIPLTTDGRLDMTQLDSVLTDRTKIVAVCGMSNVLGTVNPVRKLAEKARQAGACIVVDGAQSVPHLPTDVISDDIDFLVFSGHKVYGPTGIGVLYGKPERLDEMDPVIFGGHMISEVRVEGSQWAAPPAKFEAGTMPIVQAIALGTAIRWIQGIGIETIHLHEQSLLQLVMNRLSEVPGIRIYGPEIAYRGGIVSFRIADIHPEDLAALLDQKGVFTRHGHHCTMPLHTQLGVSATTRVSLAAYNTEDDVESLMNAIQYAIETLSRN